MLMLFILRQETMKPFFSPSLKKGLREPHGCSWARTWTTLTLVKAVRVYGVSEDRDMVYVENIRS